MSDTIKAALILASALILAALLHGGIYQIVVAGAGSGGSGGSHDLEGQAGDTEFRAYRLNRLTGSIMVLGGPANNIFYPAQTPEQFKSASSPTAPAPTPSK
jgi:hypothetical protein